jgi:hypothetical protein
MKVDLQFFGGRGAALNAAGSAKKIEGGDHRSICRAQGNRSSI